MNPIRWSNINVDAPINTLILARWELHSCMGHAQDIAGTWDLDRAAPSDDAPRRNDFILSYVASKLRFNQTKHSSPYWA